MTFLFWNAGAKDHKETIARLALRHKADVLMLAECPVEPGPMLLALNREETQYHFPTPFDSSHGLTIYVRFDGAFLKPVEDYDRMTIRSLEVPGVEPILLVLVHWPSKLHRSGAEQNGHITEMANFIREIEDRRGHRRTVLVGDLNVNPFEDGMIGAYGLHAVMTRGRALQRSRRVDKQERPFFYNPMWGRFGDTSDGPPGTYHHGKGAIIPFWNIFDQVLLRPDLLTYFDANDLEVLTGVGEVSFLSRGREGIPDKSRFSDHLPLLFRLSI